MAKTYDITGDNINNVMHYCCLQALNNKTNRITHSSSIKGCKRKYLKEDKMF